MARNENGAIIGTYNGTTLNSAQGVFTRKSQFVANENNMWPRGGNMFLAYIGSTTPYIAAYNFSSAGWGTKFSDPSTLPTSSGNINGVRFSPDGKFVATVIGLSPWVHVYPWSASGGFGTKVANPTTLPPGAGRGVDFTPASDAISVSSSTSPYVASYQWSSAGFGTKYGNPATALPGTAWSVRYHPTGNEIAFGHTGSPLVSVYKWTYASGFGTRYAAHSSNYTTSVTNVYGLVWHPTGSYLGTAWTSAGTTAGTKVEATYGFDTGAGFNSTFYQTSSLNATSSGGADINSMDFSNAGYGAVFAGSVTSGTNGSYTYVRAFPFNPSTGFGTEYTFVSLTSNTPGAPQGMAFSPDDQFVAAASTGTAPNIHAWPWVEGSGLGTKLSNPATIAPGNGFAVAWVRI